MNSTDLAALTGASRQLAEMLDSGTLNPAALQGIRLQCDLVLARYYAERNALPGCGTTSLPSFVSEAAAIIYASELSRRDQRHYEAEPVAERWVVRLAKWESTDAP